MPDINPFDYKRPGTAEYVVAKANLVRVESTREDDTLAEGPALRPLFREDATPRLDRVAPAMSALVTAHALSMSGFVDGSNLRVPAVATLREEGITEAGLAKLQDIIRDTAKAVGEQRTRTPAKPI